jgi:predicted GNAT superfamily acetyltransferase
MEIRRLDSKDVAAAWQINEQGLPGTGKVSHDEMADLLSLSELPIGVFDGDEMLGFVLCLTPRTRYASLNYAWFNQRYQEFLYVDRIAVAVEHRDRGIGSLLYGRVIEHGKASNSPLLLKSTSRLQTPVQFGFMNGIVSPRSVCSVKG